MSKHLRIWLFALLGMLLASTTLLAQGVITMTASKAVGETVKLRIEANGNVTIEGVKELPQLGKDKKNYTLTSQTITIHGDVTKLDCSDNQLTSLDLPKSTVLTWLWCSGNQLTSLDLSNNTALTTLGCSNNQLTSLNVSKNTALIELNCALNQLTSLDMSKNTALGVLYCFDNQLTNLDVSKNIVLTELYCALNQLTSLDVSKSTTLTKLDCRGNQLTSLNISGCTALTKLDCSGNQLTSLDLSQNTALYYLDCSENQLTSLNISGCAKLTVIGCYSNYIKGKAMTKLVNSLPNRREKSSGTIFLVDRSSKTRDKNRCSAADVATAKKKNWEVRQERLDWGCKLLLVRPTRGRLSTTSAFPSVVRGCSPSDRRLRCVGPLARSFLSELSEVSE